MVDLGTLAASIIGFLVVIIYLVFAPETSACVEGNSEFESKIRKAKEQKNGLQLVLKDYQITNKEIERRENITLLIGSILITGSVLVLSDTATSIGSVPRFPYAFTSILLFSLWLLVLHTTTKRLDNLSYSRIRAIEKALSNNFEYGFGIHTYLYSETKKNCRTVWWLRLRRAFWGLILLLLSSVWFLLSLIT